MLPSGQPAVLSWLRARATSRSATPATCMPRVSRACDRNMVPNLPAPISADGDRAAGGLAFEKFGVKVHAAAPLCGAKRNTGAAAAQASAARRPGRTIGLLAERAGNEGLGVASGPAAAARQIDLRRADLGGGHVEALAGCRSPSPCTWRWRRPRNRARHLARARISRGRVTTRAVGSARDRVGRILGGVDRRPGGNAGLVAQILERFEPAMPECRS